MRFQYITIWVGKPLSFLNRITEGKEEKKLTDREWGDESESAKEYRQVSSERLSLYDENAG